MRRKEGREGGEGKREGEEVGEGGTKEAEWEKGICRVKKGHILFYSS